MDLFIPGNIDFSHPRCTAQQTEFAGARAFVLDNSVIRLAILPEHGGRICSIFYRPANLELLATEFLHGPRKEVSVRGGWCAAFPSLLADGEVISRIEWDGEISEHTDEQVTVRLWCMVEKVSHQVEERVRVTPGTIIVERYVRLQAGESAVTVDDVLTNRNVWPMATTWSGSVNLRAQPGDRAVAPVESVEVLRGVGPYGNELDFGLLVATPFQAVARDLREGELGMRLGAAPVDLRLSFDKSLLPYALIGASRDENRPAENAFRFQPMATPAPIADDTRGGALVLPPMKPVTLSLRLEIGSGIIGGGEFHRPGLQLSEMITDQRVPTGRVALWRVGEHAIALKTPRHLMLLMPEFGELTPLTPADLPGADLLLFSTVPDNEVLAPLLPRSAARFLGTAALRQQLRASGVEDERSVALSPGVRFDLPGLGILATPAINELEDEHLGYILTMDHLSLFHTGVTQFISEFNAIGEQFHPQLLFLPLAGMSAADAVHAARQLQPRLVIPLGDEDSERDFINRCRAMHLPFPAYSLFHAEGRMFDGWKLQGLG